MSPIRRLRWWLFLAKYRRAKRRGEWWATCGLRPEFIFEYKLRPVDVTGTTALALMLMAEVAGVEPSFEDERVGYVEVQIDRETWLMVKGMRKKP